MDDPAAQLIEALDLLAEVGDALPAHQAVQDLDDATLQLFWREWPRASAWAGTVWRLLDADLGARTGASEQDDIGGSG